MHPEKFIKKFSELAFKYKYVLLILLVGLILISFPTGGTKEEVSTSAEDQSAFELKAEEQKLEEILSSIDGVGRVKVALSIKTGSETVFALDEAESVRDESGGDDRVSEKDTTKKPVLASSGSSGESPLKVKEKYPEFRGALVVCEGADNAEIRLVITEAVCSLTGITSDHISVIKMKG